MTNVERKPAKKLTGGTLWTIVAAFLLAGRAVEATGTKEFDPFVMKLAVDTQALRLVLAPHMIPSGDFADVQEPLALSQKRKGTWSEHIPIQSSKPILEPAPFSFAGVEIGNGIFVDYNRNIVFNVLSWLGLDKNENITVTAEAARGFVPAPKTYAFAGDFLYLKPGEPPLFFKAEKSLGSISYGRQGGKATYEALFEDEKLGRLVHTAELKEGGAVIHREGERVEITFSTGSLSARSVLKGETGEEVSPAGEIVLEAGAAVFKVPYWRDPKKILDVRAGLDPESGAVSVPITCLVDTMGRPFSHYEILRKGNVIEIASVVAKNKKKVPYLTMTQGENEVSIEFIGRKREILVMKGENSFTVKLKLGSKSYESVYKIGEAQKQGNIDPPAPAD
ncbi:MAG TPA: hypothetical protein DCM05_14375 [Elusimicrobia bacterium]|nr:hypothetical protein [Elusimicrobiota bacterium]